VTAGSAEADAPDHQEHQHLSAHGSGEEHVAADDVGEVDRDGEQNDHADRRARNVAKQQRSASLVIVAEAEVRRATRPGPAALARCRFGSMPGRDRTDFRE
jgi:hypothetical protein